MTLSFPNPSRSFDDERNAVRFSGHDGMSQVRFLVEVGALEKSGTELRGTARRRRRNASRRSIQCAHRSTMQRAKLILTAVMNPIL
jgi:hypothetical protein